MRPSLTPLTWVAVVCVLTLLAWAVRIRVGRPVPRDTMPHEATGYRIDLNTASPGELMALPGIGADRAALIVEHRTSHGPFESVDDLIAVHTIGTKVLAQLRPWATVTPSAPAVSDPP